MFSFSCSLEGDVIFLQSYSLHEICLGLFNFPLTVLPQITLFTHLVNPNILCNCLLKVDFVYELSKCQRNKIILAMF